MKYLLPVFMLFTLPVAASRAALHSDGPPTLSAAPYLLPGAPTFDMTITQFRNQFTIDNPTLAINEFHAITSGRDKNRLTRAATKINENLYASTALERGTLKIKSLQITWLPIKGPEQKSARAKALEYMAAMLRMFTPALSKQQSQEKLNQLLSDGKGKGYFAQNDGAIRYVVADHGEKGLTFAVEPIKLALSETLNGGE